MGLNLPIRRIIFTRDRKFDGQHNRPLYPAEIRQIGGRAGRFGVYEEGFVTALMDSEILWQGFDAPTEPIEKAMLGFSDLVLRVEHDLLEVLQVWNRIPAIAPYQKMPIDRYILILKTLEENELMLSKEESLRAATIPFDERDEELMDYFLLYCEQYLANKTIAIPHRTKPSLDGLELYASCWIYTILFAAPSVSLWIWTGCVQKRKIQRCKSTSFYCVSWRKRGIAAKSVMHPCHWIPIIVSVINV